MTATPSHMLAIAFLLLQVAHASPIGAFLSYLPPSTYMPANPASASSDQNLHTLYPRVRSTGRFGQKRKKRTIGFAVAFSIFGAVVIAAAIWWWVRRYKRRGMYSQPKVNNGPAVAQNGAGNRWFGQSGITANPK